MQGLDKPLRDDLTACHVDYLYRAVVQRIGKQQDFKIVAVHVPERPRFTYGDA